MHIRTMKRRPLLPLAALAAVLAAPACMRTQAKVTPDAPLEVPPAPPRDVEVSDSEPPPPATLVPEPARNPSRLRPPTTQPRAEPPRPEPPKPDTPPPPSEPPKPVEEPRPAPPPSSTLQTTPPTAEGEVERAIRAALSRANNDLSRVDYRALNTDARTQYDTAKRFVQQADRALHEKNLVFAKSVADKAAALAAQLAGR